MKFMVTGPLVSVAIYFLKDLPVYCVECYLFFQVGLRFSR